MSINDAAPIINMDLHEVVVYSSEHSFYITYSIVLFVTFCDYCCCCRTIIVCVVDGEDNVCPLCRVEIVWKSTIAIAILEMMKLCFFFVERAERGDECSSVACIY